MGYYTNFDLEVLEGEEYLDYKEEISKISKYNNCFNDSISWYRHEDDMRKFSKKHPKTLFKLSGHGEDNEDIWIEYYLNGKMQRTKAKITFDEFDKSKLK